MPRAVENSPVVEFYNNATIFITGGTGFLGKALIEKLLRVCSNMERIYVLIRMKKGKDPQMRMKELFEDPLFQTLREEKPDFEKKVTYITGDINSVRFSMSDSDYEMLTNEVTHVFHSAATVKFNEPLKAAVNTNVLGTQEIIRLCEKCVRLKVLVHVSTAFSNCIQNNIDESFYDPPLTADKVINLVNTLSEEKLSLITPELIKPWPNTYVYTKAIAENLIKEKTKSIPTAVFRPSIVMGTLREPIAGWIDNIYGPTGVILAVGLGLMRVMYVDSTSKANIVPVDLAVNALITSAWEIGTKFNNNSVIENSSIESTEIKKKQEIEPKIYNFVLDNSIAISWGEFIEKNFEIGVHVPSKRAIWYYSITITKIRILYLLLTFFLHHIPSILVDVVLMLLGRKPQMRKAYQKLHGFSDLLINFVSTTWVFQSQNVRSLWYRLSPKDKELFNFNTFEIDWDDYFSGVIYGIRIYILHENMQSLPAARRKMFFFWLGHRFLQFVFFAACFWILSKFFFTYADLKTHFKDTILMSPGTLRNST